MGAVGSGCRGCGERGAGPLGAVGEQGGQATCREDRQGWVLGIPLLRDTQKFCGPGKETQLVSPFQKWLCFIFFQGKTPWVTGPLPGHPSLFTDSLCMTASSFPTDFHMDPKDYCSVSLHAAIPVCLWGSRCFLSCFSALTKWVQNDAPPGPATPAVVSLWWKRRKEGRRKRKSWREVPLFRASYA